MALFGRRQRKAEQAQQAAYEQRKQDIEEAQALALFATTEGEGISERATIDLSLDDEEDELLGRTDGGLYL